MFFCLGRAVLLSSEKAKRQNLSQNGKPHAVVSVFLKVDERRRNTMAAETKRRKRGGGRAAHADRRGSATDHQMPWKPPINIDRPTETLSEEGIAAIHDGVRYDVLVFGHFRVVHAAADQALDGKDSVFGVGDRLALRRLAHKTFVVSEGDNRRRRARTFCVFDDPWLRAVHDCDAAVGGSKVDTNDFGHALYPLFRR